MDKDGKSKEGARVVFDDTPPKRKAGDLTAGQLDLKALARALGGSRAAMAEQATAERATGYVAGGISPVGQKRAHPTVVDRTALDHPTVFVSAGRRGLDLEIAPDDLVAVTTAVVAAVGRPLSPGPNRAGGDR